MACKQRGCRFRCKNCDAFYCFEHVGMHYKKGDYIPKGFGTGLYKAYCQIITESDSEQDSDEVKDESDSELDSETS